MYVGVDLDATARTKGPRQRMPAPSLDLPGASTTSGAGSARGKEGGPRRSKSFTPPSARLTQPTKSQQRRRDIVADTGAQSARSSGGGASSRAGAPAAAGGAQSARASSAGPGSPGSARKQLPAQSARSPFGTPGSTSRARTPAYVARLSAHEKTHSPSGRFHPDSLRRREIRGVDMHTDIDYYAPHGAPDNDRKMKEQSWLCSQAFIESLRVYPDPFEKRPIRMPGER